MRSVAVNNASVFARNRTVFVTGKESVVTSDNEFFDIVSAEYGNEIEQTRVVVYNYFDEIRAIRKRVKTYSLLRSGKNYFADCCSPERAFTDISYLGIIDIPEIGCVCLWAALANA